MRNLGYAMVTIATAMSAASLEQDQRSVYRVDFPLRINSSMGADTPMGKAELTIWTRGDSAFGLWRTLDEDSLRFDNLFGKKEKESIFLYSAARPSLGRTPNGPASLDIRYEFRVTRQDDSLRAEMTLAIRSALEGRGMSSPTVSISGVRVQLR